MATTYATRTAIKDLLQTRWRIREGGRAIDTSESYTNLQPFNGNAGNSSVSRVDYDDSFVGFANWKLLFTDNTSYTAFIQADGNEVNVAVGSGTKFNPFTAVNPWTSETLFSIQPSYWSGHSVVGDYITWRTNSVISNDFIDEIINDAEVFVDAGIQKTNRFTVANRQSLMFTAANVPSLLQKATKYLAAYMVYSFLLPTAKMNESEVFQWFRIANISIDNYVASVPTRGPQWITRKPIVPTSSDDKVGTPFMGADMDWRQNMWVSFEDVISRLRDYRKNVNQIRYSSLESNFP